jgi:hypothetical protein
MADKHAVVAAPFCQRGAASLLECLTMRDSSDVWIRTLLTLALLVSVAMSVNNAHCSAIKDLRTELIDFQTNSGLSLVVIDRQELFKLEFATGKLTRIARLPKGAQYRTRYAIAPNARRVAGNLRDAIWVADIGRQETKKVSGFSCLGMELSHDSSMLAYVTSEEKRDTYAVFMLDYSSCQSKLISSGVEWGTVPQWSPDDKRLTFHSDKNELVVVTVERPDEKMILGTGQFPSWSSDGKAVLFRQDQAVFSVSIENKARRCLIPSRWSSNVGSHPFRCSPCGKYGVYCRRYTDPDLVEYSQAVVVRLKDMEELVVCETPLSSETLPMTWAIIKQP